MATVVVGFPIEVRIDRDEITPELGKIVALGKRVARSALQDIGERLAGSTQARFVDSRGPVPSLMFGQPAQTGGAEVAWQPPAPATLLARKKSRGTKPLIDRGDLWHSIESKVVSADEVQVGTQQKFKTGHTVAILQLGGYAGRGRTTPIPARPFLGVTRADVHEMERIVSHYLSTAVQP